MIIQRLRKQYIKKWANPTSQAIKKSLYICTYDFEKYKFLRIDKNDSEKSVLKRSYMTNAAKI